jgi:hypothetical protein
MDVNVIALTGLTGAEVIMLAGEGVANTDDLSILTHEDVAHILPQATTIKKRKLSLVSEYVSRNQTVTDTTTVREIQLYLNTPIVAQHPNPVPPVPLAGYTPDPSRGAPKMHINALKEYGGSPIDYEDWSLSTKSTLGQTQYANLLTVPPTVDNVIEETRDRELFHMLVKSLMNGSAMHILQVLQDAQTSD